MRQLALADLRRQSRNISAAPGRRRALAAPVTKTGGTEAVETPLRLAVLDKEPLCDDADVGAFLDRFQDAQGVEVDLDSIPGDALGTVVTLLELERLWQARKSAKRH